MKDRTQMFLAVLRGLFGLSLFGLPLTAAAQWQPVPSEVSSALTSHWSVVEGPLSLESRDLALASCDTPMTLAGVNDSGPSPAGLKLLEATKAKGDMQISTVGEDLVLATNGLTGGDWNREDDRISFDRIEFKGALQAGSTIIVQAEVTARKYKPGFFDETVFSWSSMSDADRMGSKLLFGFSTMTSAGGNQLPIVLFPLSESDGQPNDQTQLYVRCGEDA